MTQKEFSSWTVFYRAYPFDDFHRHCRPAALIAQSMAGGSLQEKLDWLQPPTWQQDLSASDVQTLKAFGIRKEDYVSR